MDPVANMKEQLDLANAIMLFSEADPMDENEQTEYIEWAGRLAELVIALDEWRRKGGWDIYTNTML